MVPVPSEARAVIRWTLSALLVLPRPGIGPEDEDESRLATKPGAALCRIGADDLPP